MANPSFSEQVSGKWRSKRQCVNALQQVGTQPSVGREENRPLARSDWPRSRTQEGGREEGRGRWGARVEGNGGGERRGGGGEERGGGEGGRGERNGGGEGGGGRGEGRGEEGGGEGGLPQLLLR